MEEREKILEEREKLLNQKEINFLEREKHLDGKETRLLEREKHLDGKETRLLEREKHLDGRETRLDRRDIRLDEREKRLERKEKQPVTKQHVLYGRSHWEDIHDRERDLKLQELLRQRTLSDLKRRESSVEGKQPPTEEKDISTRESFPISPPPIKRRRSIDEPLNLGKEKSPPKPDKPATEPDPVVLS